MTDPFVAAIRAEPDDDLPRLIYADWLDEHGDPRGPFVRAQVALAQLPADDPQRSEWASIEAELLADHAGEWLGDIADELVGWCFHRGFIEVKLDLVRYLEHEHPWMERSSVIGVHLYAPRLMDVDKVAALAESPLAERVRSLDLGFEWIRDAGVKMLADSPYLIRLAALDLRTNGLSDTGAESLARSTNLPALRFLCLANNLIGDSGAEALAQSSERAELRQLDLSKNEITSNGAVTMARANRWSRMESLKLSENKFDGRSKGGRLLRKRLGKAVSWK